MQKGDITIAQALKPLGYATGQFGKNHLGDKDEYLPTVHGFDEFFGNLYHLNAEEEPERPYWPKDDKEFLKQYNPRGVLKTKADGKGGQTIEDTGPLTKKRMETIDDETTAACIDFMQRQRQANKPFFTWMNTTRMHAFKGDVKGALAGGEKTVVVMLAATHAGMSTEEFQQIVKDWLKSAQHPIYHRPYTQCVYQPMLELLGYLRANNFKTFIVSGGGVEFMRAFAEETYGIPPEQVIGSSGKLKFELRDGQPVLLKLPMSISSTTVPGKPAGIQKFIGRRPVMAFGNSDGDLQILQWTTTAAGPRFALLIHHTDSDREIAYDRNSSIGKLDKALDEAAARQWIVVNMKSDWKTIFPQP